MIDDRYMKLYFLESVINGVNGGRGKRFFLSQLLTTISCVLSHYKNNIHVLPLIDSEYESTV